MGERLLLALVNEAAYCLQEGILLDPISGDLGAVMGIGFPPFEGGPFRYCDRHGAGKVVARMQTLAETVSPRFEPCPLLVDAASSSRRFHGE